MIKAAEQVEKGGILFIADGEGGWSMLDYDYGMVLGTLKLEEGPGWILQEMPTFLDMWQLKTIYEFSLGLEVPDA